MRIKVIATLFILILCEGCSVKNQSFLKSQISDSKSIASENVELDLNQAKRITYFGRDLKSISAFKIVSESRALASVDLDDYNSSMAALNLKNGRSVWGNISELKNMVVKNENNIFTFGDGPNGNGSTKVTHYVWDESQESNTGFPWKPKSDYPLDNCYSPAYIEFNDSFVCAAKFSYERDYGYIELKKYETSSIRIKWPLKNQKSYYRAMINEFGDIYVSTENEVFIASANYQGQKISTENFADYYLIGKRLSSLQSEKNSNELKIVFYDIDDFNHSNNPNPLLHDSGLRIQKPSNTQYSSIEKISIHYHLVKLTIKDSFPELYLLDSSNHDFRLIRLANLGENIKEQSRNISVDILNETELFITLDRLGRGLDVYKVNLP